MFDINISEDKKANYSALWNCREVNARRLEHVIRNSVVSSKWVQFPFQKVMVVYV